MINSNPNDHDPSWDYGQTWPEGNSHDYHYMIKDPDPDNNHVINYHDHDPNWD